MSGGDGTEPRVSVILPVYNGASMLGAAIESVRAQTFDDWELVVVDDGSTDDSVEVAAPLAGERRIRLVRQAHAGLAAVRNRGLDEATGNLVAFLDADDLWTPGYLATMTATFARWPGLTLASGSWRYIDEAGELLPQTLIPFGGDSKLAVAELPWRNSCIPSATVARTDVVRQVGGFDVSLLSCEDWDLWLRLLAHGSLAIVPEARVHYRANAGSLTENLDSMERHRLRVNQKHHGATAGEPTQWSFELRRAVAYTLFVSGLGHFRRGSDELARMKVRRAIELWPGLEEEDELYYELACARQARGRRGPSPALDLDQSARLIEWSLPERRDRPFPARASLALGILGLLAGDRRAARRHARQALKTGGWDVGRRALELLAVASLPSRFARGLREWRRDRRSRRCPAAPSTAAKAQV